MTQPYIPSLDTCDRCRFWRDKGEYLPDNRGSCHRHAPHGGMYAYEFQDGAATQIFTTPFPTTMNNDTCGDFDPKNS